MSGYAIDGLDDIIGWQRPSGASELENAIEVKREGFYVLLRGSHQPLVQFVLTIDEYNTFTSAIRNGEMDV